MKRPKAKRSSQSKTPKRSPRSDTGPSQSNAPATAGARASANDAAPQGTEPREGTEPRAPQQEPPERGEGRNAAYRSAFPIVGIGASAGGLEALEQFLGHAPEKGGMAFVIIQHLDPTHKGALVELLQRVSTLPVTEAQDGQKVQVDRVYVIPPNTNMSILGGTLHLVPQVSPRVLNLPIDYFFRSLAEDQREAAIGVVLSGMGSDGTLGLRAIKESAGATFVQSLSSAKFDGMPRSALDAGVADVVAQATELPERIIAYLRHAAHFAKQPAVPDDKHQNALEKIFILLRSQSGNDFSLYKQSTVQRRIERRMGLHQVEDFGAYVKLLRDSPSETRLLCRELLIGVTSFFREPDAWSALRSRVLPGLLQARAHAGVVRAWVPGCSTGEEAYSLSMVLHEAADELPRPRNLTFQIFATDLDGEAIERARQGSYPANIAADVSPERLRRFFSKEENGYRIRKDIRETIVYATHNVITDPPFTKLDVLSCRNLLIYLSAETQRKLIPLFHYALSPGGILFLGSAETVGGFSSLFGTLDVKGRLYSRLQSGFSMSVVEFPSSFVARDTAARESLDRERRRDTAARESLDRERRRDATDLEAKPAPGALQAMTDHVIVQRFAPPVLLTNDKGDILYISGRTGNYLEPALGKANMNVFAMARDGLRVELAAAFAAALNQGRSVTVQRIKVRANGSTVVVDLTVQKLQEPTELRGLVIIVLDANSSRDVNRAPANRVPANKQLAELQKELEQAREEAQTTREEMQTSQEELKSTNEELESTNEELQSTNEELTTSKEEMQSMNEELQTVNRELQSKLDDLARSNNDMRNLLNSTDVATLFLDSDLLVRRFTIQTTKVIKLIPSDTGRPITDISSNLEYPELVDDAREVLRTLAFHEKQVHSREGLWYSVRIMPYRTLDNAIDGLVITFTDTTAAKKLEGALRDQADQARQMAEALPTLAWGSRPDGATDYLSPRWLAYTGVPENEQLGYGWLTQVHPDDRERVRSEWKAAIATCTSLDTQFRLRSRTGSFRWFQGRSVPIRDEQGQIVRWYGMSTDVDDLKQAVDARQLGIERMSAILDWISEPFVLVSDGLTIAHANAAMEDLLGRKRNEILNKGFVEVFPAAAGTLIEEKVRRRELATIPSFELDGTPRARNLRVWVYPHEGGVALLFKPTHTGDSENA